MPRVRRHLPQSSVGEREAVEQTIRDRTWVLEVPKLGDQHEVLASAENFVDGRNCPVRLMDSRTFAACVATSKALTLAVPASALSRVDRIFTTVVLPAPFEPSSARCCPAPRRSQCGAAPAGPCTTSPGPARGSLPPWSFLLSSLRVLDGLGQAGAFLVDPLRTGVGLGEGLGELDRVVADDLADRRPICGSALQRSAKSPNIAVRSHRP